MRAAAHLLLVLGLAACATAPPPREVPPECPPPPPPIYAKDCVRKGDVLEVADQILRENERHASALSELEKSLSALKDDVARALEASLRAVPASEASVAVIGNRVRVRLSDDLLFPSGSAQIGAAGLRALEHVAEVLRVTPSRRIEVNGHTDTQPTQKQWQDNWQLSSERARQVALYLLSHGIPGKRVLVAGYADTDPVDPADNPVARAHNRRVELFIEPTAPEVDGPDEDGPGGLKHR
jgi:chemotaxis protein MotB